MKVRLAAVSLLAALLGCRGDPPPSGDSGCASATCGGSSSADGAAGSTTTSPTATASTADATGMPSPGSSTVAGTDDASTSTGPGLEPSSARHTPRPLGDTASPQGYWEYLPPTYDGATPHPLLVYLHGIAANGNGTTELDRVLLNGPPDLIDRDAWPYERPFVVLSPQHMGAGCPAPGEIQALLAYAIDAYAVEPSQVYLTGISCGAIGAWDYLANFFDDQIAAALLIAGDGRGAFAFAGCALGVVPLWAFHGEADDIVDPLGTIEPLEALLACEPPPVDARMTLFPGVRHESWHQVYDLSSGHDVYAWLLSH
ncbi:MAG: hypothetical protein KDK70_13525 [Myxococcales bacterium]|nr:hypothetical protein [Myxococcales bacterium]